MEHLWKSQENIGKKSKADKTVKKNGICVMGEILKQKFGFNLNRNEEFLETIWMACKT